MDNSNTSSFHANFPNPGGPGAWRPPSSWKLAGSIWKLKGICSWCHPKNIFGQVFSGNTAVGLVFRAPRWRHTKWIAPGNVFLEDIFIISKLLTPVQCKCLAKKGLEAWKRRGLNSAAQVMHAYSVYTYIRGTETYTAYRESSSTRYSMK